MSIDTSMSSTRRPKLYVGTACDQCFRCKARCAGEKPICARCKISQSPCTYSTGKKKKCASEQNLSTASSFTCGLSTPNLPDESSSASRPASLSCDHWSSSSIPRQEIGTTLDTRPYIQASLEIDEINNAYSVELSQLLAVTATHSPPTPQLEAFNSCAEIIPENDRDTMGHQAWASSLHRGDTDSPQLTMDCALPCALDSFSANLEGSLVQLYAYSVGISRDTYIEILSHLQRSLAVVCNCLTKAETVELGAILDEDAVASLTPQLKSALTPVVAMMCVHVLQLVLACYVKLRKGDTKEVHPYKGLLDAYITRDMQMCQAVAGQLETWCRKLTFSIQSLQLQQDHQDLAMLKVMTESLGVLSLMAL